MNGNITFNFLVTRMVTQAFQSVKGADYAVVSWTKPQYTPTSFTFLGYCRYFCSMETYHILSYSQLPPLNSTVLYGLKPGSVCVVTLHVKYNHASIDPGIDIEVLTAHTSKYYVD